MNNLRSTKKPCPFSFLGCLYQGCSRELEKHKVERMNNHMSLVCTYFNNLPQELLSANLRSCEEQLQSEGVEDPFSTQASMFCTYEEVQTLQATSYDGHYIWKIPDITRCRRDVLPGKTVSLYSAPFYTSRFGYRLCLCVYLDGDGSGKGRYISYFLTIMKGEYDALLEWPFQHMATMTLVNQKGNNNIVQSFRPNPTSTSFHRPKSDMNVAFGCPKFAPLSILDNPEFVVDDVVFFKCVIKQS